MQPYSVEIVHDSNALPDLRYENFFHSKEFFLIVERSSGISPYMAIATDSDGNVVGHILAIIRRRGSLFPPYIFSHARIFGEGEYAENADKEAVFAQLMAALTKKFRRKLCLYAELSDVSRKMFGYRTLKENGYFAVPWQEIHQSLTEKAPFELLSAADQHRIEQLEQAGVTSDEIHATEDVHQFYKILSQFYRLKIRRYIPYEASFAELLQSKHARLFITRHRGRDIGVCACYYTMNNAYLWFVAAKRKTYSRWHPQLMTIWAAINDAHKRGCQNFNFLDCGLPFAKSAYRDFILRFGGTPVSKFRWFRISLPFANKIMQWFFRE